MTSNNGKMIIKDSFDITPNTNLLDVLGHSGYSLQSAIADIMDNSITAKADNIWLNMRYDGKDSEIVIVDDGYGMDLEKLKSASIIAFKDMHEERSEDDLGRFSTGINSASASMCNQLIIQSKTADQNNSNTIVLDYEEMKTSGWVCKIVDLEEDFLKSNSGTAIVWRKLKTAANAGNRHDFYKKISVVEKHISHVFNDYITSGLQIHINNDDTIVKGWDPFFISNPKTTLIYDESVEYHGSKVGMKIYILPPFNNLSTDEQAYMKGYGLSDQQGFYIYRKNRLIKEGGWLGIEDLAISNKYDYARIRVDIDTSLDKYFDPNFLKNEIFIPDDLKDFFKKIAIKSRNESRKSFNYMKAPSIIRSVKTESKIPVWNCKNSSDGLILSVNEEHPIVKSLVSDLKDADRRRLFKLLSKNIPVGEITRSGVSKKQNAYLDITKEMNEMYEKLKDDGLSNKEILKKMTTCEPFCISDDYISLLIEFFESKGAL